MWIITSVTEKNSLIFSIQILHPLLCFSLALLHWLKDFSNMLNKSDESKNLTLFLFLGKSIPVFTIKLFFILYDLCSCVYQVDGVPVSLSFSLFFFFCHFSSSMSKCSDGYRTSLFPFWQLWGIYIIGVRSVKKNY